MSPFQIWRMKSRLGSSNVIQKKGTALCFKVPGMYQVEFDNVSKSNSDT